MIQLVLYDLGSPAGVFSVLFLKILIKVIHKTILSSRSEK